jgi:predicted kinase
MPPGTGDARSEGGHQVTLAYLDPGSGSLIASVLVGGVAAAGVAAKQARARLGGFGRKRRQDAGTPAEAAEAPVAQAGVDDAPPSDGTAPVASDT